MLGATLHIAETMSRRQENLKLAAEAGVDPRTADKWRRGGRLLDVVDRAITEAAERLGMARDAQEGDAA